MWNIDNGLSGTFHYQKWLRGIKAIISDCLSDDVGSILTEAVAV